MGGDMAGTREEASRPACWWLACEDGGDRVGNRRHENTKERQEDSVQQ